MADDAKTKDAPPAAPDPKAPPKEDPPKDDAASAPEEPRIAREVLIAESRGYLGVASHVAAGALHDDDHKTFTIDQAKDCVKKFLKRPADTGEES
ncbi:MAG: hypothetical protein ACRDPE_15170 [Solirubrobacterales bacterium]